MSGSSVFFMLLQLFLPLVLMIGLIVLIVALVNRSQRRRRDEIWQLQQRIQQLQAQVQYLQAQLQSRSEQPAQPAPPSQEPYFRAPT